MSEIYFTSDTHFGHRGIISFEKTKPFRPFETIEEHDEALVANWNNLVNPKDIVFHLGDFCFGLRNLPIAARLNGSKRLVLGNHDLYGASEYLKYFDRLFGVVEYKGMFLSHIPVHVNQFRRMYLNVHGHLHTDVVTKEDGSPDHRYFNVSVERHKLMPIPLDEIHNHWAETRDD